MNRDLVILRKSDLEKLTYSFDSRQRMRELVDASEGTSLNPKNIGEFLWYAASFIPTTNDLGRSDPLAKTAREGLERFSKQLMESDS